MVLYCKTITLSCKLTQFSHVILYTDSGQQRQSFLVVAQVLNLVRFHLFFLLNSRFNQWNAMVGWRMFSVNFQFLEAPYYPVRSFFYPNNYIHSFIEIFL